MNEIKNKEASEKHKIEVETNAAKATAEKLTTVQVKIKCQSGSDGRLYGSVTTKDIAEELKKQHGIEIDKRKIQMDAIKAYGSYTADVKLYNGIVGKVNILVCE